MDNRVGRIGGHNQTTEGASASSRLSRASSPPPTYAMSSILNSFDSILDKAEILAAFKAANVERVASRFTEGHKIDNCGIFALYKLSDDSIALRILAAKPIDGVKGVLFTRNPGGWSTDPNYWQSFTSRSAKPDLNSVCKILSELKEKVLPMRQFSTVNRFVTQDDPAGTGGGWEPRVQTLPSNGAAAAGTSQRTHQVSSIQISDGLKVTALSSLIYSVMTNNNGAMRSVFNSVKFGTRISEPVVIDGTSYALYKLCNAAVCLGKQFVEHIFSNPNGIVFRKTNDSWSLSSSVTNLDEAHQLMCDFEKGSPTPRENIPSKFLLPQGTQAAAASVAPPTSSSTDSEALGLFQIVHAHFTRLATFQVAKKGRPICKPVNYNGNRYVVVKSGDSGIAIRKDGANHNLYKGAFYSGAGDSFQGGLFDFNASVTVEDVSAILKTVCRKYSIAEPAQPAAVQAQLRAVQPQQPGTSKKSKACTIQ